jgi:hypothetical protein
VPSAVVVAPDRIGVEEHVHRDPRPVVRLRYLAVERDADFTEEVPRAVGVAVVRTPEVGGRSRSYISRPRIVSTSRRELSRLR